MMLPVFSMPAVFRYSLLVLLGLGFRPAFAATALEAAPPAVATATPASTPQEPRVEMPAGVLEVRSIAAGGAPRLALHTLDAYQSASRDEPHLWMSWEKERIAILSGNRSWQDIALRLARLPAGVSDTFRHWAMTRRADALIKSGQADAALQLLQGLIWNIPEDTPERSRWLLKWRFGIMNAYLALGAFEDAHLAAAHYFRDAGSHSIEEKRLQARILISANRADQAADMLEGNPDMEARIIFHLAQLRSARRTPATIVKKAQRLMRSEGVTSAMRTQLWALIAEASRKLDDLGTTANALEHVLSDKQPLPDGMFRLGVDDLWQTYLDYATRIGNSSRFLIGDDGPWFEAAGKAEKKLPVRARSLYAMLMFNGESEENRLRAAGDFVGLLKQRKRGGQLLKVLFLESRHFASKAVVPLPARYVLVDVALAQTDIPLASAIMATIDAPPEGVDNYFWQLRRARILVMGGHHEQAAEALHKLLASRQRLSQQQIDQFLQVVFDLQTVQAHREAISLFQQLMMFTEDIKQQRELYYWMAESSTALQDYPKAAQWYLRSAMLPGAMTMDPWAQTARYQAADNLARAGYVQDARAILKHLLRVTREPARQAVLRQELQKLWLVTDRQDPAEADRKKPTGSEIR